MLTQNEIDRRRPVWLAFSEFWLDTELGPHDLERLASAIGQSGFSISELRRIHLEEVAPVLYPNLLSPAGEWAGFDEEWLCGAIVQNIDRTGPVRRLARCLARPVTARATERDWHRLRDILVRIRESAAE